MLLGGFPFGIPSRASACGQKVCSFCAPALSSQSVLPEGWYRSYLLRPPSPASYPWSAKDMGEGAAAAGRDLSVLSELDRLNGGVGRFSGKSAAARYTDLVRCIRDGHPSRFHSAVPRHSREDLRGAPLG